MSLLVWLPLNGNLKNQGINNVEVSVSGTTSYTIGKIGKGLSCNGSSFWNIGSITLGNNVSIAWWAKTSDTNAMFWVLQSDEYSSLNIWSYNGKLILNKGDGSVNTFQNNGTDVTSLADGKWHHYVTMFDGTNCSLYIDGAYYATAQTYRDPTTTNKTIRIAGGFGNTHTYDTNGVINDFRVYDHCLPEMEIKELSKGLVMHYKLDNLESGFIIDSSGNNNNMTIVGSPTLVDSPKYSKGTHFAGGQYAIAPEASNSGYLPTDALTVNIWAKWSTWGTNPISCTETGGFNFEYNSTNGIRFPLYIKSVGYKIPNSGVMPATLANAWHMLTGTFDGSTVKIYIDGVLKNSVTTGSTNGISYSSARLCLAAEAQGATPANSNYVGDLSDVRIYSTALSNEDILKLYQLAAKIDSNGKIHSYELEETSEGRELIVQKFFTPYPNTQTPYIKYSKEGIEFTSKGTSLGSSYIEINPINHIYRYDFTISVAAGNQFDIGFERYDENKTPRSNNACVYPFVQKPTTDIVKKRYTGTVNLSTDGTNPCKYIRLRVLNGWSGSTSSSTYTATIHNISLREISPAPTENTKLLKTGVFKTDLLLEGNTKAEIEKNLDTNINEFIEL